MNEIERKLLDAVNAETVRQCIADNAARPRREWHGPLLVEGAQRRADMIAEKLVVDMEIDGEWIADAIEAKP